MVAIKPALYAAACAWIEANTAYRFVDGAEAPDGVALFIERYAELMDGGGAGVASESIGGMSQSFTGETPDALLRQYAAALMPGWYKTARFTQACHGWNDGC